MLPGKVMELPLEGSLTSFKTKADSEFGMLGRCSCPISVALCGKVVFTYSSSGLNLPLLVFSFQQSFSCLRFYF